MICPTTLHCYLYRILHCYLTACTAPLCTPPPFYTPRSAVQAAPLSR
jgi:hypothetical protein